MDPALAPPIVLLIDTSNVPESGELICSLALKLGEKSTIKSSDGAIINLPLAPEIFPNDTVLLQE